MLFWPFFCPLAHYKLTLLLGKTLLGFSPELFPLLPPSGCCRSFAGNSGCFFPYFGRCTFFVLVWIFPLTGPFSSSNQLTTHGPLFPRLVFLLYTTFFFFSRHLPLGFFSYCSPLEPSLSLGGALLRRFFSPFPPILQPAEPTISRRLFPAFSSEDLPPLSPLFHGVIFFWSSNSLFRCSIPLSMATTWNFFPPAFPLTLFDSSFLLPLFLKMERGRFTRINYSCCGFLVSSFGFLFSPPHFSDLKIAFPTPSSPLPLFSRSRHCCRVMMMVLGMLPFSTFMIPFF